MQLQAPFILASRSPRRKRLLEQIGIPFSIEIGPEDEVIPEDAHPADIVQRLALHKAESIATRFPEALTLGADTIVVFDGNVLGKPTDEAEARKMLRRLSGNTHTVFTGLALVHEASNRRRTVYEETDVTFSSMTENEIANYVATGSPMDKAGAYGIQDDRGALFVSGISGDYYNVVGLPLHRLYTLLKTEFPDLLANDESTTDSAGS